MKLVLSSIAGKRGGFTGAIAELLGLYTGRSERYTGCKHRVFASEARLLEFVEAAAGRTRAVLVLADGRGQMVSSVEFAGLLGAFQDGGAQLVVFAVGPADGWSAAALSRADRTIAFGRITLPHELAAVVLAEQVYRALTIRAGHPYHSGHE